MSAPSAWIYLAAPNSGMLQTWLGALGISLDFIRIYSIGGVIWVLALFYTPYVYLFVIAPMRQMDAALEDAARVHGASFWYTLRHVTVPLLMPSLLSGALVVFVTSAGLFDVPLALAATRGIRTMPTEIFQSVQYPSDFGRAAAFGVVVMTVTIAPRHPAAAISRQAPLRHGHRQGLPAPVDPVALARAAGGARAGAGLYRRRRVAADAGA